MANLEKEFDFFKKNMLSLYKRYGHKFLVIKNEGVIGVFDTFDEAVRKTIKKEEPGTFLVQECFEKEEDSIHCMQSNFCFIQ